MFTAIVLSANPVRLNLSGVSVLPSIQLLKDPAGLHTARLDSIVRVTTPYCFFLDDDDDLPVDYLSVLQECAEAMDRKKVPMAYTDELLIEPGQEPVRRCWYDYNSERHAYSPMGVHHLALMATKRAKAVATALPRGEYWTEHMLYWALGREGAVYVPRVGYHWRRRANGFSRNPRTLTAQMMSRRWIKLQQMGHETEQGGKP